MSLVKTLHIFNFFFCDQVFFHLISLCIGRNSKSTGAHIPADRQNNPGDISPEKFKLTSRWVDCQWTPWTYCQWDYYFSMTSLSQLYGKLNQPYHPIQISSSCKTQHNPARIFWSIGVTLGVSWFGQFFPLDNGRCKTNIQFVVTSSLKVSNLPAFIINSEQLRVLVSIYRQSGISISFSISCSFSAGIRV